MDMYQKRKIRQEKKNSESNQESLPSTSINWYPGHMPKAKRLIKEKLDLIDVVYEVVDSRMPLSSRLEDVEEIIKNKPRILIFNKYDLCDEKETNKWIKHYESEGYKVLPYNLDGNPNMNRLINATLEVMNDEREKRENKGLSKRKIRVLVLGIPNVGKSTLINRLAGKKVALSGNTPGVTKNLSWIRINEEIELLDTPGILWPKLDEKNALNLASFTAIREEVLPLYDVVEYILKMLNKYYQEKLFERYGITDIDDDIIETLEKIGKKRGCLIKGGEIDYDKVISVIVGDIKNGYIKGITFDRYK